MQTAAFTPANRAEARKRLRTYLIAKASDRRVADECVSMIHTATCMYAASKQDIVLSIQTVKGVRLAKSYQLFGGAIDSLERLERTGRSVLRHGKERWYPWAKAWAERTYSAHQALLSTGKPVPIVRGAPRPADILPLIPAAKSYARKHAFEHTTQASERNAAIIAILRAYKKVTGKVPPISRSRNNPTIKFITAIEDCYRDLIPEGFGISGSHSMLEKLRSRAFTK